MSESINDELSADLTETESLLARCGPGSRARLLLGELVDELVAGAREVGAVALPIATRVAAQALEGLAEREFGTRASR